MMGIQFTNTHVRICVCCCCGKPMFAVKASTPKGGGLNACGKCLYKMDADVEKAHETGHTALCAPGYTLPVYDIVEDKEPPRPSMVKIPVGFPVRPLRDNEHPKGRTTCGECGLSWDDDVVTSFTPAPSARCPFEAFHDVSGE